MCRYEAQAAVLGARSTLPDMVCVHTLNLHFVKIYMPLYSTSIYPKAVTGMQYTHRSQMIIMISMQYPVLGQKSLSAFRESMIKCRTGKTNEWAIHD